jgi:broad specificity phosphatase PhoE
MPEGGSMDRPEGAPPAKIMLIRHGEKPPPLGPPKGIKEDGREDDHSLVVRGWQRAGALAAYFCYPRDGAIVCPTKVYAPPETGKAGDHGRPYQTVSPVAAKLGTPIDVRFTLDEEPQLAADVLSRSGVVLIAWEHKRIHKIANAILGDETTAPQTWPDDRFDVVWIFDREASGRYRFDQRPQLLLAGDRPEVIRA